MRLVLAATLALAGLAPATAALADSCPLGRLCPDPPIECVELSLPPGAYVCWPY